jgi:hypothetical protein
MAEPVRNRMDDASYSHSDGEDLTNEQPIAGVGACIERFW